MTNNDNEGKYQNLGLYKLSNWDKISI